MEFIPSLPILSAFTLAGLALTLTPGPDMTLFLGRALTQGRAAGMAAMLGASSGIVIHTLLAAFGISALIQASPVGFLILKVVGALYLLWLAIQAIREGSAFSLEAGETRKVSLFNNWLTGIGINMLNPKIVIFFITFLPQFVTTTDPHAAGKMVFLGFYFIVIAIICSFFLIFAVDQVADSLKRNPKITRIIDWVFAGVFSAFAVRILFTERG
ncbi:MAG: LysE family translocator [Rhizobiaceae bacterium]|nr:LysE family translocator [Rhizobiaceae bacterium]